MKKYLYFAVLLLCWLNPAFALESGDYLRMLSPSQEEVQAKTFRTRGLVKAPVRSDTVQRKDSKKHEVAMHLQFKLGSAELTPQSRIELQKLMVALSDKSLCNYKFKIEGHTCDRGSASQNLSLSKKRALNVADFLVNNSPLRIEQFEVEGYGESSPAVPNVDEYSRQKNRRVVIRNTMEIVAGNNDSPAPSNTATSAIMQISRYHQGRTIPLQKGEELNSGDHYAVNFTTGNHRYAYVCQKDSMGAVSLLFPDFSEKKNPVSPQTRYRVPAEGEYFTLDNTVGKEQILLLAFDNELPDPKQACITALKKADTSKVVHRGLGGITSSSKIDSAASAKDKEVFAVEMNCGKPQQLRTRGIAGIKEIPPTPEKEPEKKCQGIALEHYFMHK